MKKLFLLLIAVITTLQVNSQAVQDFGKVLPDTIYSFNNLEFGRSVAIDGNFAVVGEPAFSGYTGRAYVFYYDGVNWTRLAKLTASDGATDDYFGFSVSISGNTVVIGAYKDDVVGLNSGSAYVFEMPTAGWTDMTQTAKLIPSDGAPSDAFGISVSISGNVVVIGANGDDDNGNNSGSAYVFEKPTTGWSDMNQTAKLKASDGTLFDSFGTSVSISGDVISIGTYGDDDNGSNAGSVYVFEKPVSGWINMTQTAKLLASDGAANDALGRSVCISGNVIVAGAFGNTSSQGAVYVFEMPVSGWTNATQTAKLTASDGVNYDYLGYSVCISGDVIVAGAYRDNNFTGSAYVFEKPLTGWNNSTETAKLTASNGAADDWFGEAVGISGDIILSGSVNNYTPGINSGAAYTYHKPTTGWASGTEDFMLNGEKGIENNNAFGHGVSISGNFAVVGQPGNNESTGRAYIFEFDGTAWNRVAILTATDGANSDQFGYSVSISGSVVAIGAWGDDDNGTNSGSIYIFEMPANGWKDTTETAKLTPSDGAADDNFGFSVSIDGDVVVAGAYGDDDKGNTSGSAYIFVKPTTGWASMNQTAKLTAADGADNDNFGHSVSIWGDVVVVGAYLDDDKAINSGSAYVFVKPASGWTDMTQTAKLTASDGDIDDNFGFAVDIHNDVIAIGANMDDDKGPNSGSAYVFVMPQTGWADMTQTAKLTASDGAPDDFFGSAITISGNQIVIGAAWDNDSGSDSGSAYVFDKPSSGWINMNETVKFIPTNGAAGDQFGISVGIDNYLIIAGAIGVDDVSTNNGAAYFYKYNLISQQPVSLANVCDNQIFFYFGTNVPESNYQWQISRDGGANFSDLSDDQVYAGVNNDTLRIFVSDSLENNFYRCLAANLTSDTVNFTLDQIPPELTVKSSFNVYLDSAGQATIKASDLVISATDNCTVADTILSQTVFDCSMTGQNNVNVTLADARGNQTQAASTVFVIDSIGPELLVKDTLSVSLDVNNTATIKASDLVISAKDNCLVADTTLSQNSFDCSHVGNNNIVVTLIDVHGNQTEKTSVVKITDPTPPELVVKDIVVYLDNSGQVSFSASDLVVSATDNCAVADTVLSTSSYSCANTGANNVTVGLIDAGGNVTEAIAVVTVLDTIKPTLTAQDITVKLDLNGQATITADDVIADASDNCVLGDALLSQYTFTIADIGDVNVDVTQFDVNGNSTTQTIVVTVVRITAIADISEQESITLYPNPVQQFITIKNNDQGIEQIEIYNTAGKQVLHKKIDSTLEGIDVRNLEPGVFLMKIRTEKDIYMYKFIKE